MEMLGVTAFAGLIDQPLARQALAFLEQKHKVYTATLDETARPVEAIAVFVVSKGTFPSKFLRKLPEDPEARRKDIERRGFEIPEGLLATRHVFVLKPPADGGVHRDRNIARFQEAVANACGFVRRTRRSRRGDYLARQEAKKSERRQNMLQLTEESSLRPYAQH